ncbi:MAG: hypothetical protein KY468_04640 [Armatimonadetes bacterium]|nr:hypothetical protein [Armatimonadota bacterium]
MRSALRFTLPGIAVLALISAPALSARKPPARRKPPAKPAPKKPAPAKAAPAAAPLTTGAFSVTQPLARAGDGLAPSGPPAVRGLTGAVRWMRHSHYQGADYPLFPPVPMTGAPTATMPGVPVLSPRGELNLEPARWLTVASGTRALTVPVGAGETLPAVQLTPQVSGNVAPVGTRLPLGVTVTNASGAARNWTLTYRAQTASGTPFASGQFRVTAPAMSRVTTPLVLEPFSLPGSAAITVSGKDNAGVTGSATTGGGAVVPDQNVKTGEFPFGLVGGDLPLAEKAGVQFWAGGWPWWKPDDLTPPASTRAEAAPGFPEGFFFQTDRLGIAPISRAYVGSAAEQPAYSRAAMNQFKRRAGGWMVPYTAELTPEEFAGLARSVYSTSKSIHKDAPTLVELPVAGTTGLEIGQGLGASGAALSTDALAVRGLGVPPSDESFQATLEGVRTLRNTAFPARKIWNTGETLTGTATGAAQQAGQVVRSSVEQIAAGVDKVFWTAPSLLAEDGSAKPGFFGLSSLSGILGGSEYVGPMPWEAPLRGEVFQKNGAAILVAWSTAGTRAATLPVAGRTPLVFDPMQTRANLLLTGAKLSVTPVPVYVTDLGRNLLTVAYGEGRKQRLQAVRAAYSDLEIPVDENLETLSNEEAVRLLKAAMDAYRPEAPRRGQALNAVHHLLNLWDLEVLARASARPSTDLLLTNKYLDQANRASADLRVEMDYQEGTKSYQPEMRHLLNRVEDRMLQARLGLRQKDYALAQAHAEQMALAARALVPYVKVLPTQPL